MISNSAPQLIDKAVIDVGSNSVRLVIFRTNATFFQPIFNEKVSASLGRGVMDTGLLNPKGVNLTRTAMSRFMKIIKARGISSVYAVATAAVRDADDGADFLAKIETETGLKVKMLPGAEEARLSALGVIAGEPTANGLMADLGGSSLELVRLADGKPGVGITHKLGPLAMGVDRGFHLKATKKQVTRILENSIEFDPEHPLKTLYAVGGAWRSLALLHIELRGYPLHILHNYRLSYREAKSLTKLVERQSPESLAKVPGISARRAATLPYAALLLGRLLKLTKVREVIISSFGLREGLLYDDLPAEQANRHPVLASVEALAHQNWSSPEFGLAVEEWLSPIFAHIKPVFGVKRTKLLQTAVCQIADIGARMHPDHRAEIAFDLVLFAPFAGLTHEERTALALVVFHRCAGPVVPPRIPLLMRLVDEDIRSWATTIGLGLRCASAVSGRTKSLLEQTSLYIENDVLTLDAFHEQSALLTTTPGRRLRDLADAMGLQSKLTG